MLERFDRYMARCLYDAEHGFYGSGAGAAGRREGDFITSPEVGPLFGRVLANALDHWWDLAGQPDPFPVVDAGTGPGALALAIARAPGRSAEARTVLGVDRSPDGATDLPDDLTNAVVVANELLDNLPFRVVERTTDGWSEIWVRSSDGDSDGVGDRGDPRPVEALEPLTADLPPILAAPDVAALEAGARVPVLTEANAWVTDVLARNPVALVCFDYGTATTAELGRRGGWLRTYRRHQRGDDPYTEPGSWDITTDVAVDQLPIPTELTDQRSFLRRWGIDELVDEGRSHWRRHAAAPDVTALTMRSRVREADALLDPAGLGRWLTCTWLPSTAT